MNRAEGHFGPGKISAQIAVAGHSLIADEPADHGGDGQGPSPHDYVATALAACTVMTLRLYAQRKEWPLQDVKATVTLDHTVEQSRFERVIQLVGPLDQAQRTRLVEIANRCPIHRLLSGKISIETRLAE